MTGDLLHLLEKRYRITAHKKKKDWVAVLLWEKVNKLSSLNEKTCLLLKKIHMVANDWTGKDWSCN